MASLPVFFLFLPKCVLASFTQTSFLPSPGWGHCSHGFRTTGKGDFLHSE